MIALLLLLLTAPIYPDPVLTPGAVNQNVTQANLHQTVCVSGWTKTVRPPASFTTALKKQQMADWGLPGTPADYEEDHLVSLEIGGAPRDPKNLWPEPYAGPWGAKKKDTLETVLKRKTCTGAITLDEAQKAISSDWIAAYKKYVSGNVLPNLSPGYHSDQGGRNAKPLRQLTPSRAGRAQSSDLAHSFLGQLSRWPRLAATDGFWMQSAAAAPLFNHVPRIVNSRPEKEMVRTDTWRVVAVVQHVEPFRNGPIVQTPGESVRATFHLFWDGQGSVTTHRCACPQPATVRFLDERPESFDRIAHQAAITTRRAAVYASTSQLNLRRRSREGLPAHSTTKDDGGLQSFARAATRLRPPGSERLQHWPDHRSAVASAFDDTPAPASDEPDFVPACSGEATEAIALERNKCHITNYNTLHALVCTGTISFAEAQRAIATDWETAYRQYVGPR